MTEETEDIIASQWRSKKYQKLSDEEILELSLKKLPDKDRYYLIQELEYRCLSDKVKSTKVAHTKKEMRSKPWWKLVPLLFALAFVLKRMYGSF